MRVIIAGSRKFNNYDLLEEECLKILRDAKNVEIVSGHANGTDKMGERFAEEHNYPVKKFEADWNDLTDPACFIKYGKDGKPYNALAGFNRNRKMAQYASKDNGLLIAFWDNKSPGTKNMIEVSKIFNVKTNIIKV